MILAVALGLAGSLAADATALLQTDFAWRALVCFGLTVLSAVFPWMSVEIIVLALPAAASSPAALAGLVLAATAGQMAGKSIVYWTGRSGASRCTPRMMARVDRWRDRMARARVGATGLIFLSSAVGVPPFFVITAVAGAVRISFPRFLLAGTAGRLLRFGALVLVPQAVGSWLR
jgi:membrane protein YqaA with SNARE-associated domain